jgi:hypothetical protein
MPISEESREKDDTAPTNTFASDDKELDEEGDQGSGEDTDLNKETKSPDNSSGSGQKLLAILKKIDFVIQRITSSASKRLEFDVWLKKLDENGPNLIAGYGIRWNVKWQSQDRAYRVQNVVNKLIENEKDWQERDGGKNFFQNYVISLGTGRL